MKTLKYAARFLIRAKSYTLINLLGLAFSLACCIILMRYIHRELTVDTHCVDREQVYAVKVSMEGGEYIGGFSHYSYDSINLDKRYIDKATHYTPLVEDFIDVNGQRFALRTLVTDSVYFQLFPYPVVQGKIKLDKPESVLLKKDFAQKIFGNESPIGKVIRHSNGKDLVVEGILDNPSCKTSLQFDMVLSYELSTQWERMATELYRFMPNTDMKAMNAIGSKPRYLNDPQWDTRQYTFSFLPIKELYWQGNLHDDLEKTMTLSGIRSHILILSGVCLLMLLTGILNFVNLYLVAMLRRGKEYGLKKVYGASGFRIFLQIGMENFLLIFWALMVAWLIVEVTQIPVGRLLNMPFFYTPFDGWLSLGLLVVLPLVTSIYPFIKYNYAPPVRSIQSIGWSSRSVRSRMMFLGIQYVLTFLLVVFALYFDRQLGLMLNTEPGFRTENIINIKLLYQSKDFSNFSEEKWKADNAQRKLLRDKIAACPYIEYQESYFDPLIGGYGQDYVNEEGKTVFLSMKRISPSFFKMFNIDIEEGALLEKSTEKRYHVLNRSAMKAFGFSSLEEAKVVEADRFRKNKQTTLYPIEAVVEDYYAGHLSAGAQPTIYEIDRFGGVYSYIAYQEGNLQNLLASIKETMKEIYGVENLEYTFLEDDIKALYDEDRKVATIYTIFALIAIAISCLGLFGISLFDIRQRYREIGIRKVNGAKIKDLYRLLFRKYVMVLIAAFVVAIPIAYYLITLYTQDFVVKAPIGIGIFIIALLVVSIISLGTLFWQVHKAANINPADVVKSE